MSNKEVVFWVAFSSALALILGGSLGSVTMKWAANDELRSLRAQNHELAEEGRRLAAAAYVCMEHCGTPTCEPKAEGKP